MEKVYKKLTSNNDLEQVLQQVASEVKTTGVFPLQMGRLSSSLQIPGELTAFQQVDLYAKENSFVKKLNVDVGSEVTTG